MLTNKEIAQELIVIAGNYPETSFTVKETVFKHERFSIKCQPNRGAILNVAKKFNKGGSFLTSKRIATPSIKQRYSSKAFEDFCKDGEYENAVNYARGRQVYFAKSKKYSSVPIVKTQEITPGFVIGRIYVDGVLCPWEVTHLDTGKSCGCASLDKAEALRKFKLIDLEKLTCTINRTDCGYQEWSVEYFNAK